jgi:subtilisin family serine protease
MRWIHAALRKFRAPTTAPRHSPGSRTLRPCIEPLEDRLAPATTSFQSVIGLPQVQAAYPYNGAGYSVAILDSGIDYNDPNLGGGYGPGYRVIAGYNFVANNNIPLDDNGHGTLIADEIASSDPNNLGIAPDVNLIDLKVLDSNLNGSWSNIDQGLQWVIAHKTHYNIVAVNLSLGSGNYTTDTFNLLETDLANLKALGVFTAVASGNNFYADGSQQGLAYPAVDPAVVSVGATWAGSFPSAHAIDRRQHRGCQQRHDQRPGHRLDLQTPEPAGGR